MSEDRVRVEVRTTFEKYTILSKIARDRGFDSVGELIESLIDKALELEEDESLSEFPSETEKEEF